MKARAVQPTKARGLLANGSERRWDVAVEESLDGGAWSLEIDGPRVYLVFQLHDLDVIAQAMRFLQAGPPVKRPRRPAEAEALHLGRFGSAAVSLLWDDEDFPRCFLVIGPRARSTLRWSLEADDIHALGEALRQVQKDLTPVNRPWKDSP